MPSFIDENNLQTIIEADLLESSIFKSIIINIPAAPSFFILSLCF